MEKIVLPKLTSKDLPKRLYYLYLYLRQCNRDCNRDKVYKNPVWQVCKDLPKLDKYKIN